MATATIDRQTIDELALRVREEPDEHYFNELIENCHPQFKEIAKYASHRRGLDPQDVFAELLYVAYELVGFDEDNNDLKRGAEKEIRKHGFVEAAKRALESSLTAISREDIAAGITGKQSADRRYSNAQAQAEKLRGELLREPTSQEILARVEEKRPEKWAKTTPDEIEGTTVISDHDEFLVGLSRDGDIVGAVPRHLISQIIEDAYNYSVTCGYFAEMYLGVGLADNVPGEDSRKMRNLYIKLVGKALGLNVTEAKSMERRLRKLMREGKYRFRA